MERSSGKVKISNSHVSVYHREGVEGNIPLLTASVENTPPESQNRDYCAKFAAGLFIIVKSAFLFNFLTRFDYKHLKQLISEFQKAL